MEMGWDGDGMGWRWDGMDMIRMFRDEPGWACRKRCIYIP